MRVGSVGLVGWWVILVACTKTKPDGSTLSTSLRPELAVSDVGLPSAMTSASTDAPIAQIGATGTRVDAQAAEANTFANTQGFRLTNRTARMAYVDAKWDPVKCESERGTVCSFFMDYCPNQCSNYPSRRSCCIQCEAPLPSMIAIPSGGSKTVPWNRTLRIRNQDRCLDCACDEQIAIPVGSYVAMLEVYANYVCEVPPCREAPDGRIVGAAPRGTMAKHQRRFSVPSVSTGAPIEIVIR